MCSGTEALTCSTCRWSALPLQPVRQSFAHPFVEANAMSTMQAAYRVSSPAF